MNLRDMVQTLEEIAPLRLAEAWDNVGLLAGDPRQPVRRVLLTVDLTRAVLAEAKKTQAQLIVAYHPPIWEPLQHIVPGPGPSGLMLELVRNGLAVYAPHTAWDAARGGVNDLLAKALGLKEARVLQPAAPPAGPPGDFCKLAVFVPEKDLPRVSEAIFAAGGGRISAASKYGKCSFRTRGTGTFFCGPRSRPTIGQRGKFEQVDEIKLETVVPRDRLGRAVAAMLAAHSYEEVAYDVYPMLDVPGDVGLGRVGELEPPATVPQLIGRIRRALRVKTVGLIGPRPGRLRRVAVAAGAAGSLVRQVIRQGCQFFLTGELNHHHALELREAGVTAACVGHSHSERLALPHLAALLRRRRPGLHVALSRADRDPFTWG